MDVVQAVAYAVMGAAAVAGGILIAGVVWRRLSWGERPIVHRAPVDRRQRAVSVRWERRVWPRRLEDLSKGFLAGSSDAPDSAVPGSHRPR